MVENENGPVQVIGPERKRHHWAAKAAAVAVLLFLFSACWIYLYAVSQGPVHVGSEVRVYIPPKTGFQGIKTILIESGVIDDDIRFAFLTKVLGAAKKLKAGEYLITPGSSPLQIIEDLAAGKTVLRSITIAEGVNLYQMAEIFAEQGWSDKESFLSLARAQSFIHSMGINAASLEGYLFPDTYFFPWGEDIRVIVGKMVSTGKQVMAEECNNRSNAESLGGVLFVCLSDNIVENPAIPGSSKKSAEENFSIHQILTLASIIEKETALEQERPVIAKVFLNRLAANMKLQADPTLIYGLQKFGEPLAKIDLVTPGPYNTYMNKGLPPGPICNPGRASIRAVFQPSDDSFYYFVSQNDGSHFFSKSLKEHNRAVLRLRKLTSQK